MAKSAMLWDVSRQGFCLLLYLIPAMSITVADASRLSLQKSPYKIVPWTALKKIAPNNGSRPVMPYTWTATATHYSPAQGGHAICGAEQGYCGAPSDGSAFWSGDVCKCGETDPTCSGGYCYDCNGANLCKSECPSCPKTMCGKKFKITCVDPYGKGYCKYTGASVVMTVTNACPQYNPCNTCKSPNPCRADYNHIDLCDVTFDAIAVRAKQPAEGILIGVDQA